MFHTRICELCGIKYPIFQGGMAWVSDYHLASAVSEAGGLGIIAAGHLTPEEVREQIRKTRERTSKPFGVNVMFMSPYVDDIMQVVIEEKVAVVTTGAGSPGKYVKALKEAGIRVIPVVASVALAQRMEREGVDAVIAEGMESGGHVGDITTMALVPQVVDAVEIPVIAAGGIGDARGFLAALMLGAEGVQMGTRFALSKECAVHENWKKMYIKARDRDTVVTGKSTGHPVRVIKNKLARKFEQMEKAGAPKEEIENLGVGALRRAALEGDVEWGSVMAGQIVGLLKEEKSVKEIIEEIITGAKTLLKEKCSRLGG
ncbi:enoyl-[acyl carrier protein] reductase II [Thermosulfidibacter takaii ABI70S6]|uniref:Enoyl-[acyl carrier protein] reductase II n=1 Tax=Thermosulfidibacter takaii (strain DSM 17441 / JCM 13301 / NBRC 103674 / ABI70S6) TaxID=1298851 RepID=A0A0S3QUV4_THET7|nr:enoyl-[acyl-carrier-protein] reductase FabK [Thermosulfidibacter takaii]BAT72116.1 enoyl-[acyl carrier protein] reductase II [Thermosulfidibacter takaii ABI70S6]